MKLTIQDKTPQASLAREVVTARLFFEAQTPSRLEVLKALAKELKVDESLVVIASTQTHFGSTSATVHARVYNDAAVMKRLERDNLLAKHEAKQEAAAE